jgi:hypothetical protein
LERRQGTPVPDWVPKIYLSGQAQAEEKIKLLDDKISDLKSDGIQRRADLDDLLAYKKLLFEKGKTQLEPIALKALNTIGFCTSPAENIPGTNFEIDGRTTIGSSPGIVEVKGSKNQIGLDEFAPFTTKILADLQATNTNSKGILVGNGRCLDSPGTRFGSGVFSAHVLDAAKRNSVALVNSVELYSVVCNVLDDLLADLGEVRERILGSNGYVDLRPFIKKFPF